VEQGIAVSLDCRWLELLDCTAGLKGQRTNLGGLVEDAAAVVEMVVHDTAALQLAVGQQALLVVVDILD